MATTTLGYDGLSCVGHPEAHGPGTRTALMHLKPPIRSPQLSRPSCIAGWGALRWIDLVTSRSATALRTPLISSRRYDTPEEYKTIHSGYYHSRKRPSSLAGTTLATLLVD